MAVHYLTVQDILWINSQVTKKVNSIDQVKLEEAAFYQYAYGDSKDVTAQSARFLPGFVRQMPFSEGNEATAFVAFATFLEINGKSLILVDNEATGWFKEQALGGQANSNSVRSKIEDGESHHGDGVPDVGEKVAEILVRYSGTIRRLDN